jgi:glutathione S-transferase
VPAPPLFDPDPAVAARQRFLEDWSDESLYWYVMALRWTDVNAKAAAAQVLAELPLPALVRPLLGLVLPRRIRSQAVAQGLVRLPLEVLLDELGRRFDELLVWLGDRPFLFSDRVGAADLAVFGQLNTLASGPTPQGAALVAARPALAAWVRRVDAASRE